MKYIINGGKPLHGNISVSSAKNAVLVQMASAVLASGITIINNVDKIQDVLVMVELLECLGCEVKWKDDAVTIDANNIYSSQIPKDIATSMRASIFMLGALLGRTGCAYTYLPGGCAIGSRPIDIHLDVLGRMGVHSHISGEALTCTANHLVGDNITLRMPSVGATENAIMCAVLANGVTMLHNCAIEPEVVALCKSLIDMGANIEGVGSRDIVIIGVDKLHGTTISPIADRIVAGTYLVAGCMTHGNITVNHVNSTHIEPLLGLLDSAGVYVSVGADSIHINCDGYNGLGCIRTAPYPQFPTDMQSLVLSMATLAKGNTTIVEQLFENRLAVNCRQLCSMGANIVFSDNMAEIIGVDALVPSQLRCGDLRGGAGLVLVAIATRGCSIIDDIYHIDRGYYRFDEKLSSIGADIQLSS